ncbi:MAG: CrcB family protein [Muribaculaceae bacterium]|nr:CrcB family protein [Muribaculaceae bacterium]MDE7111223.1 CrcB family protein [Muribaculaceae bacterium]
MIPNLIIVAAGGALGAVARYGLTLMLTAQPLAATMIANILGSLIIGAAIGTVQGRMLLFLSVGLCGGFTTFSTFSNQTLTLIQSGNWAGAAAYAVGSVTLCIAATLAGYALVR